MELYPSRDTFVFDQGHMTKNQPITVLILLSESLGMVWALYDTTLLTLILCCKTLE